MQSNVTLNKPSQFRYVMCSSSSTPDATNEALESTAVADCAVVRGLNLANKTDLQWGLNNINYNYLFIILLFFIVMVIQHLLWFNLCIYIII